MTFFPFRLKDCGSETSSWFSRRLKTLGQTPEKRAVAFDHLLPAKLLGYFTLPRRRELASLIRVPRQPFQRPGQVLGIGMTHQDSGAIRLYHLADTLHVGTNGAAAAGHTLEQRQW